MTDPTEPATPPDPGPILMPPAGVPALFSARLSGNSLAEPVLVYGTMQLIVHQPGEFRVITGTLTAHGHLDRKVKGRGLIMRCRAGFSIAIGMLEYRTTPLAGDVWSFASVGAPDRAMEIEGTVNVYR